MLYANGDKEFDVSLDAANCDNNFYRCEGGPLAEDRIGQRSPPSCSDGMTVTGGTDNDAKREKCPRQRILEECKRYFEQSR